MPGWPRSAPTGWLGRVPRRVRLPNDGAALDGGLGTAKQMGACSPRRPARRPVTPPTFAKCRWKPAHSAGFHRHFEGLHVVGGRLDGFADAEVGAAAADVADAVEVGVGDFAAGRL